jgi:hypothetical protein
LITDYQAGFPRTPTKIRALNPGFVGATVENRKKSPESTKILVVQAETN